MDRFVDLERRETMQHLKDGTFAMPADLTVRNLKKEYPTRDIPLSILRGVSFELSDGQNMAILGPSGCGKSTLLHIIGTLDAPTSGSVLLKGEDPFKLPETQLALFRNSRIGFIFQDHHLLPQCTVLENTLLPLVAGGSVTPQGMSRGRDLLERVGLSQRLEHRPGELSGGERQRVAIARSLICRPALLLADEPTGNLDRGTAAQVSQVLLDLQSQEKTMMIVVTHSVDLASHMQRRAELDQGLLKFTT